MYFGKYNTQELHGWIHNPGWAKWVYTKDPSGTSEWFYFYNALHNLTSTGEKIVDWILHPSGGGTEQIWALGENGL